MTTTLTTDESAAGKIIRGGGIVAFPTETVYGLGANIFDEDAIRKIFAAKQRPADNPLIAHIANRDQADLLAEQIPAFAEELMDRFFPGPITLVLKKLETVPLIATAGLDTIGIRMPRHELAREFLKVCKTPVVAPSANLSGRPSPTTWQAVFEDLNGRIDCILQGEPTEIGLESTVVDCTGDRPVILRQGSISIEEIREVVAEAEVFEEGSEVENRSPGLRHKHYSPSATVKIVAAIGEIGERDNPAFIGLDDPGSDFAFSSVVTDVNAYAHELFEFFRECDRRGIKTIYCQTVPETGIGSALMDRIRRAAQG